MSETSAILHTATARSLVLLDEIGRGTSTYDGVSIAWSVSEHLHDAIGCKTVFATHYHELTQLAERVAGGAQLHRGRARGGRPGAVPASAHARWRRSQLRHRGGSTGGTAGGGDHARQGSAGAAGRRRRADGRATDYRAHAAPKSATRRGPRMVRPRRCAGGAAGVLRRGARGAPGSGGDQAGRRGDGDGAGSHDADAGADGVVAAQAGVGRARRTDREWGTSRDRAVARSSRDGARGEADEGGTGGGGASDGARYASRRGCGCCSAGSTPGSTRRPSGIIRPAGQSLLAGAARRGVHAAAVCAVGGARAAAARVSASRTWSQRTTATAAELSPEEYVAGGAAAARAGRRDIGRASSPFSASAPIAPRSRVRRRRWGCRPETIGESALWVLPSPSGLNANHQLADLVGLLGALRAWVDANAPFPPTAGTQ